MPLDNRRRWYRYHHLSGDLLQSRLHDERPADVVSLQRRASEWFEAAGDLEAAVRHALAADEADRPRTSSSPADGLVVPDEAEWGRLPSVMATP